MGDYADALLGLGPTTQNAQKKSQMSQDYADALLGGGAVPAEMGTATQTPDGRTVAPGASPQDAARIPPGMVYNPETGGYVDTALAAERKGKALGAAGNFLAGGAFVGEGIDEAIGAGDEIRQETARQSIQQFQESNPKTAMALRFAGGVTSLLPAGRAGIGAINAARGPLLKAATAIGGGAVGGGVEGASSGYLRGTTPETRQAGMQEGAVWGAGIGAAAAGGGLALGSISRALWSKIKRLDVDVIADEFGVSRKAAHIVKRAIANDDLDLAYKNLQAIGDDAMLADAGPGTAALLDAASQTGGAPLRIASTAERARSAAQQPKLIQMLDNVLGTPQGKREANRAIRSRTSKLRKKAYDRAYANPTPTVGPKADALEDVLDAINPTLKKKAIGRANDRMRVERVKNQNIMASVDADGNVTISQPLNIQQMDYIKRALGKIADEGTDIKTGNMTEEAELASRLARELRDALVDAVPDYQKALRLGGDTIAERDALKMGAGLLNERVTVEDVAEMVRGASDEQKRALRQGLRQEMERRMGAVRATQAESATEARQAVKTLLDTSSDNARRKLRLALGPDYSRFSSVMDQARAALELRSAMAVNSKTAIRQSIQGGIDDVMEPNAVQSLLRLEPQRAAQKAGQAATGLRDLPYQQREAVLSEVANVLTNMRGKDARVALAVVRRAMQGQPVSATQAQRVGEIVGSQSYITTYQGLSQSLQPSRN